MDEGNKNFAAILTALGDETARLQSMLGAKEQLQQSRELNLAPKYLSEEELSNLESSVKKNTTLNKKLRALNDSNLTDAVIKDITSTNQSRFLPEAAIALVQGTLKAVEIIYRRYQSFKEELYSALQKDLEQPVDLTDAAAVCKRRALVKLSIDLDVCGIISSEHLLRIVLKQIVDASDFKKQDSKSIAALSIIAAFVRYGKEDVLGRAPDLRSSLDAHVRDAESLLHSSSADIVNGALRLQSILKQLQHFYSSRYTMTPERSRALWRMSERVFGNACNALEYLHESLCSREKKNAKLLISRGALPASVQAAFEEQKQQYEPGLNLHILSACAKILQGQSGHLVVEVNSPIGEASTYVFTFLSFSSFKQAVESCAAAMELDMPELRREGADMDEGGAGVSIVATAASGQDGNDGLWDDEHMAYFYETLPSLSDVVPSTALHKGKEPDGVDTDVAAVGIADGSGDSVQMMVKPDCETEDAFSASGKAAKHIEDEATDSDGDPPGDTEAVSSDDQGTLQSMRVIYEQLATCFSSEQADEIAINFCFVQTKNRRKALAAQLSDLFKVPLQQLPFYARMTATLSQEYPEFGAAVGAAVVRKVKGLAKNKDATNRTLEPRIASARYLAELTKFRVVDPGEFFLCLKRCLDDFNSHNIDAACELVVGAGAFMARQADTSERMHNMLGIMLRHRAGRQLDPSKSWNIENAFLACKPRDTTPVVPRTCTPLERYIQHLLLESLASAEAKVEQTVKRMRRLPWAECEAYVLKSCLQAVVSGSFERIHNLANLMGLLNKYRPSLVIALVDSLMESILTGVQQPLMHAPQACVARTQFLAELYNFSVIKTAHLFSFLYLFVTYGSQKPQEAECMDPSDSFIRIRCVLTILGSSGHYFTKGNARSKLKQLFVFFQRYLLSKESLPLDLAAECHTIMQKLAPDTHIYRSLEEVDQAVLVLVGTSGLYDEEDGPDDEGEGPDDTEEADDPDAVQTGTVEGGADANQHEVELAESDVLFEKELANLVPGQIKGPPLPPQPEEAAAVAFRVRLKRQGGRDDQSHRLELPASSSIAAHLHEHRNEEEIQRTQMKALVLAAERTQAAEESADADGIPHGEGKAKGRKSYMASRKQTTIRLGEESFSGTSNALRNIHGVL